MTTKNIKKASQKNVTSLSKITLYQYAFCPFTWKLKAFLKYKNIPFDTVEVNHRTKQEISFSTYRKVPIVIDSNGVQINDSTNIIQVLDRQYKPSIIDDNNKLAQEWIEWADTTFVQALPSVLYETLSQSFEVFKTISSNSKLSLIDKLYLRIGGTFFMYLKGKKRAKQNQITSPKKHFNNLLDKINVTLTGNTYITGKSVSIADLVIFGYLKSIENYTLFEEIKPFKNIYRWYTSLNQKLFNDE